MWSGDRASSRQRTPRVRKVGLTGGNVGRGEGTADDPTGGCNVHLVHPREPVNSPPRVILPCRSVVRLLSSVPFIPVYRRERRTMLCAEVVKVCYTGHETRSGVLVDVPLFFLLGKRYCGACLLSYTSTEESGIGRLDVFSSWKSGPPSTASVSPTLPP